MNTIELIGRFHPVLVHLPIGIFTIVLFMDAIARAEKFTFLLPSVRFMLLAGILTAGLSLVTGYSLSLEGSNNQDLVNRHQWTGIATTAAFAVFYGWRTKILQYRFLHFFTLTSLLLMLVWTGHQGGSLTHGEGFLSAGLKDPAQKPIATLTITDINQAVVYKDIVQHTLNQKCVACHGAEKQKGKLRLDAQQWIEAGGKNGELINPNDLVQSELIKRIMLDDIDEHHMPPKGKAQLTDDEKAIFQWWVSSGASYAKTVVALAPDEKITKALNNFKAENQSAPKLTLVARPDVDPIEKNTKIALEKMGWVISPVAEDDNHLRITAFNLEVPFQQAFAALLKIEKNIVELKLSFSKASDTDIEKIGNLKNLEKLWLDYTAVSDATMGKLLSIQNLEYLNIVSTNTSADGIKQLLQLPKLKTLYLQGTKTNAEDHNMLKSMAPKTKFNFGDSMKAAITDTVFLKKSIE